MVKVDRLEIQRFRAIKPGTIVRLGPCVTLLSGLNGTAKSSLLGMIAQPIGFPDKEKADSEYTNVYDGLDLSVYKSAFGRSFKTEFSNVLRMSKEFDKPKEHIYTIFLSGDGVTNEKILQEGLTVQSEKRTDKKYIPLTFKTGAGRRHQTGRGNFPHPVLYLGLERLRPLATYAAEIEDGAPVETPDEIKAFNHFYKTILIETGRETFGIKDVETGASFKNRYCSVKAEKYDAESVSAGQDNIGQLFTALLSFKRLKDALGSRYQGGVLLVDEIDASLHPIAQKMLLAEYIKYAKELKLQIVATTHSLTLLRHACQKFKCDTRLVYLKKRDSGVEVVDDADYSEMESDLAHVEERVKVSDPRTTLLFEDCVAAEFFASITRNMFKKFFHVYNTFKRNNETCLGNGVLSSFAQYVTAKKIPEFMRMVIIMDPDSRHLIENGRKNLFCLPGDCFIEKMIYDELIAINDTDKLWEKIQLTRSEMFEAYSDIEGDPALTTAKRKKCEYKRWFNERVDKKCLRVVAARWAEKNQEECKRFARRVVESIRFVKHPLAGRWLPNVENCIEKM